MSIYLVKGKGWRVDFTLQGTRHTEAWFKTKTEAKQAEAKRREQLKNLITKMRPELIQTDMVFLDIVKQAFGLCEKIPSTQGGCLNTNL